MVNGIAVLLTEDELKDLNKEDPNEALNILNYAKKQKLDQCRAYLESTDWQAVAFIKYGRPIDSGVKENCLKAKKFMDDIEACKTLKQLEKININFE